MRKTIIFALLVTLVSSVFALDLEYDGHMPLDRNGCEIFNVPNSAVAALEMKVHFDGRPYGMSRKEFDIRRNLAELDVPYVIVKNYSEDDINTYIWYRHVYLPQIETLQNSIDKLDIDSKKLIMGE